LGNGSRSWRAGSGPGAGTGALGPELVDNLLGRGTAFNRDVIFFCDLLETFGQERGHCPAGVDLVDEGLGLGGKNFLPGDQKGRDRDQNAGERVEG
jgi:hypothetical protein